MTKEKSFITLTPGVDTIKHFFHWHSPIPAKGGCCFSMVTFKPSLVFVTWLHGNRHDDTQNNETQHNVKHTTPSTIILSITALMLCWVLHFLLLCWPSLCSVSLYLVSWRRLRCMEWTHRWVYHEVLANMRLSWKYIPGACTIKLFTAVIYRFFIIRWSVCPSQASPA